MGEETKKAPSENPAGKDFQKRLLVNLKCLFLSSSLFSAYMFYV